MTTSVIATGLSNLQQFQSVGECLKKSEYFSSTLYQNVCDGTSYLVQNGFWDFVGLLLITASGLVAILLLLAVLFVGIPNLPR